NLTWLPGNEKAPDGVALGPEILTLVIEPLAIAVHHHAERHAVDAGTDAAIINRGARVDSHAMALRRIPDHVRSLVHHELEKHALIETGATDQEVLCRPLAP